MRYYRQPDRGDALLRPCTPRCRGSRDSRGRRYLLRPGLCGLQCRPSCRDPSSGDAADLEQRINGPAASLLEVATCAGPIGIAMTIWASPCCGASKVAPRASPHERIDGSPGHDHRSPGACIASSASRGVRPVSDQATRSAFAHVTSIAFEVPWTICREVYGPNAPGAAVPWLCRIFDGVAIATTAVVVTAGVAGVYSVGTLPDIGAAVMPKRSCGRRSTSSATKPASNAPSCNPRVRASSLHEDGLPRHNKLHGLYQRLTAIP